MSRLLLGNLLLLASIACAVASQLLLKALLDGLGPLAGWRDLGALLAPARAARFLTTLALLAAGYAFWVAALTRLDLSWAYPVACSSVVVVVLLSALFLGEPVTARTVLGTLLVLAGLILIAPAG